MRKAYPFHPELIDMFRLKWGNDPRFQRTRGVLRLLASIVKDLMESPRFFERVTSIDAHF